MSTFCNTMGMATLVLLVTETLKVSSRFYGILLAAAAVGSVLGGLLNPWLTRRLGQVPSLVIAMGAISVIYVGIGLAPNAPVLAAVLQAVALNGNSPKPHWSLEVRSSRWFLR